MANPLLDWDAYREQAKQATTGVNAMPNVFSNYAGLASMDPQQVRNTFYPGAAPITAQSGLDQIGQYLKQNPTALQQVLGMIGGGGRGNPIFNAQGFVGWSPEPANN